MVVVEDVLHDRAAQADAAGVALATEGGGLPTLVRADERWLSRALDCLVANAVKFTPAGGRALVRVGSTADEVWVEVADTGPGIPEDEREQVFRRLYRGRAAVSGEVAGAGLGLAIARSVVEASGGTLVVVPHRDGEPGATLRMTLPGIDVRDDEVRLP
jgi:signal transduction histidine kinase